VKSQFDLRGQDDFKGQGSTGRTGRLRLEVSARIEEVMPNGMLKIVGYKHIRVNDEDTEIKIKGFVRPLDLSRDNMIESSRVADMEIDMKGTGPASAKATPGVLTRLFNWLF
jgi:flagellar L-ring protein FlgH